MHELKQITDFHGERDKGVGASDIPILAGLFKKWDKTPLMLWMEKTGRAPRWEGNAATEWGHKLEPLILQQFADNRNAGAIDKNKNFVLLSEARHPKYKFAIAHADMVDIKNETIIEAKSVSFHGGVRRSDEPDQGYDPDDLTENGIPAAVYLQIQYQMFCYGIDQCYVPALINTNDYREYGPIKKNVKIQDRCLCLAERFWFHVESDTPPRAKTFKDIELIFKERSETSKIISGLELEFIENLKEKDSALKKKIKKAEEERAEIKNNVALLMRDNIFLKDPDGRQLAKLKGQTRENISLKDIEKHEHGGEIIELLKKHDLIKSSSFNVLYF